jgi:mono/diheme cytochrome c family protein
MAPRRYRRRLIWVGLALLLLLVAAAFGLVWRPSIAAIAPPTRGAFQPDQIKKGEVLAAAGFCTSCHTREGGKLLAGGRPLETPFGTIYGSNLTPDRDTGIGSWSLAAFQRAMREGVDRDGHHLYPAFPYDHYTRLADADVEALYAYVMARAPVRAETPAPDLPFPYNVRPLLAGWKLLFLKASTLDPDPTKSPAWNRGRYLAEALSHCSGCHSPRNALGAERGDRHFDGGEAEGWWAPPLNALSPAPVPWTEESLFNYLRSWDAAHGGGVGPMQPVVEGLAQLPPEDVRAIATYVASTLQVGQERASRTAAIAARVAPSRTDPEIESGGSVPFTVKSLAQHTSLVGPDPRNVIHVILGGVTPAEGEVGAIMPAFRGTLTEAQIADLVTYLRARFTDAPAWPGVQEEVYRLTSTHGAR